MGRKQVVVQELAADGRDPPSRYVAREDDRPIHNSSKAPPPPPRSAVPVVDLQRVSKSDGGDEADELRAALESWVLFHVRDYF